MADSGPSSIPPSAGGTGIAAISGMFIGGNLISGASLEKWLVPIGCLVFVGVMLGGMHVLRQRLGVQVDPASLRRQWGIVGAGFLVGIVIGAGFVLSGM